MSAEYGSHVYMPTCFISETTDRILMKLSIGGPHYKL